MMKIHPVGTLSRDRMVVCEFHIEKKIMKRILNVLIPIIVFTVLFASTAVGQEVYKLSMLPRYFPEKVRAMINPLAEYLSKETGLKIRPVLTSDFTAYEQAVKNGDIQIGYQNPLVYVNVDSAHEVVAMAVKGKSGKQFRGIVITRPDSEIADLSQLIHKKIMIVGKTSAGGFLSQKITAQEFGINVDKDVELSMAADNKQENVIISVSIGDVEAGFIRESALHKADKYIVPNSIKVLASTAWLPNWAFSLSRDMPEKDRMAILNALSRLQGDSDVLGAMGLKKFVAADDSQYDVMRLIMKE